METASESSATMNAFMEGRIPEQKMMIAGISHEKRLFPKVLLPTRQYINSDDQAGGIAAITQTILNNREWIEHQLMEHSALLFRGFPLRSAVDFRSFVEAFGWEEQPYLGFAPRPKVVDRVYTANEAPLHKEIHFHHEMARMKVHPSKLFLFCETAPSEGGQTAIVLSQNIPQRMEDKMPEFVSRLKDVGLVYKITSPAQTAGASFVANTWQTVLQTNDPIEAKKRAVNVMGCSSFECYEDGSADFVFGPMEAIRALEGYGGRRVWFNTLVGYGQEDKHSLSLGDGSGVPGESVEALKAIMNEESVDVRWEEGDVLLLDNLVVQHARRISKPPRRVLVSLCK